MDGCKSGLRERTIFISFHLADRTCQFNVQLNTELTTHSDFTRAAVSAVRFSFSSFFLCTSFTAIRLL